MWQAESRETNLVEVTFEVEVVFSPDAFEGSNEFVASSADISAPVPFGDSLHVPVSLTMVKPPLTNRSELAFEPTRHDVHGNSSIEVSHQIIQSLHANLPFGVLINTCNLLRRNSRIPRAR